MRAEVTNLIINNIECYEFLKRYLRPKKSKYDGKPKKASAIGKPIQPFLIYQIPYSENRFAQRINILIGFKIKIKSVITKNLSIAIGSECDFLLLIPCRLIIEGYCLLNPLQREQLLVAA
jgi:hypothetical protein